MARLQQTPRLDRVAIWLARLEDAAHPPERLIRPGLKGVDDRLLCALERLLHRKWARPIRETLKLALVTTREYLQDQCSAHAGALAYNTLLAAIPLSALLLFLFNWLFKERFAQLQSTLLAAFLPAANQEIGRELMVKIAGGIEVIGRGFGGLFALAVLLYAGNSLLSATDQTINHIWESDLPRSATKRLGNFLSLLGASVIGLMVLSTLSGLAPAGGVLIPLALEWLEISIPLYVLYKYTPVSKVRTRPALSSAMLIASALLTIRVSINYYVLRIFSHSPVAKVYGSLALIPITLLLIWLFWQLTLIGAELAFSIQHLDRIFANWSNRREEQDLLLRFEIYTEIVRRFVTGNPEQHPTSSELSLLFALPKAKAGDIIDDLNALELLQQSAGDDPRFTPRGDPHQQRAADVLGSLMKHAIQSEKRLGAQTAGRKPSTSAALQARFFQALDREFRAETMAEVATQGHLGALFKA